MNPPSLQIGDIVMHKLTEQKMLVVQVNVPSPDGIRMMVSLRWLGPLDQRYYLGSFFPEELIKYEEDTKAIATGDLGEPGEHPVRPV